MKKIVGLTLALVLVIGLVGAGTYAYFSDTESSTGNTLTAGTLDLNIDGGDIAVTTFDVSDVAPGDNGTASSTLPTLAAWMENSISPPRESIMFPASAVNSGAAVVNWVPTPRLPCTSMSTRAVAGQPVTSVCSRTAIPTPSLQRSIMMKSTTTPVRPGMPSRRWPLRLATISS